MIEAQDGVFLDGRCRSSAEEKSWVRTVPLKSDCSDFGSLFSDAILVLEGRETADFLVNWDVADPQAHCDRFVSLWQWSSEFVCGLAFSFGRLLALQAFALAWATLLVHEFQVLQEILVFFARVRARQRIVPFPPVSLAQDFLKFGLMALCLNILILEAGFRDEADDLGVRCLIFLCRLQVGGLGLGFLLALNRSRRDETLKMPARSDTHRHVRRRQKARYRDIFGRLLSSFSSEQVRRLQLAKEAAFPSRLQMIKNPLILLGFVGMRVQPAVFSAKKASSGSRVPFLKVMLM